VGRWPALVIGASMIAMHHMISHVMDLHFAIFERLAFIFLINVPWLLVFAVRKTWQFVRSGFPSRTAESF
jgi:ABC-type multidrug transport system permease subunit